MTTEPTRWSRISLRHLQSARLRPAVTTPAVMISLRRTTRTLPEHGPGREPPRRRPARGRGRPREPALPRLRRAALRLDRRRSRGWPGRCGAARAAASASSARHGGAEEALRELDRAARRRDDPDRQPGELRLLARRRRLGRAASRAPATCSRSRRCGGWSPAATRSSSRRRWPPAASLAGDLADPAQQRHLRPQRRPRRPAAAPRRCRRRSAGSGGSTPSPASSSRSRRC